MSDESLSNEDLLYAYDMLHVDFLSVEEDEFAKFSKLWLAKREAVLSRMSSPSHDRAMAEGGWQDIASAPKDGTEFLAWAPDWPSEVLTIRWGSSSSTKGWRLAGASSLLLSEEYGPIMWQPAPPTPTTKEEKAK